MTLIGMIAVALLLGRVSAPADQFKVDNMPIMCDFKLLNLFMV